MIQGDKYFLKKLQFQIIGPRIIHGQFYLKLIKKDVLRLQLNPQQRMGRHSFQ